MTLVETAAAIIPPREQSGIVIEASERVFHPEIAHILQCIALWLTDMGCVGKLLDVPHIAIIRSNIEVSSNNDII